MNAIKSEDPKKMLATKERIAYASSYTGLGFSYILLIGFVTFYYTDVLGISAAAVGTILLLSRIFDGITDLIMGWIIDRTNTKYGKARPWILFVAIPNAIACILAFAVPEKWPEFYQYIYIFITYNLVNSVTYTASNIAIFAENCLLTNNPEEHAKSGVWMQVGCNAVVFFVQFTCLKLVKQLGNDAAAWTKTIAIYAVIGALLMLYSGGNIKERVIAVPEETKISFKTRVTALFGNKYWILYTLTWFVSSVQFAMVDSGCLYYATYVLGDGDKYTTLATMQTIISVVLMVVAASWAMKKWGNVKLIIWSYIFILVASIIQAVTSNWGIIVSCNVLKGIWAAICVATPGAMMADACSYGSKRVGFDISGIGNAGINFGSKLGNGIASLAVGWILAGFGYDRAAGMINDSIILGVKLIYLFVPAALSVIGIIILIPYDLYRNHLLEE